MIELNQNNFKQEVLNADKPVIIDFWAPWCMPLKMMGPVFQRLSQELTDYKFVKVNTQENPALSQQFGIRGIPTIVVFKDGKEINRFSGFRPKSLLKKTIKSILSPQ